MAVEWALWLFCLNLPSLSVVPWLEVFSCDVKQFSAHQGQCRTDSSFVVFCLTSSVW
ncbi:hypothetical protein M758_8G103700 [Ceratodon purpureus]|nr:hypothetical protein M758_8G103700 [Ceratodon purpureus]